MYILSFNSRKKMLLSFDYWRVDDEFSFPLINYLIYGLLPGRCITSMLANDFSGAVRHSHSCNTINSFKHVANWLAQPIIPAAALGSYDAVNLYCELSQERRITILEESGLIYTSKQEVWIALGGKIET